MPPAVSAETSKPVAALGPIEVVVRHVADRMPDRGKRGKDIAICRWGRMSTEKISKIRNCVTWVTIKLFLHTQVWCWHEAKLPDRPSIRVAPDACGVMVKDGGALARATSIGPSAATGLEVSADTAGGNPRYGITRRGGNNDLLSTLWREVISLAGVARSFSSGGG